MTTRITSGLYTVCLRDMDVLGESQEIQSRDDATMILLGKSEERARESFCLEVMRSGTICLRATVLSEGHGIPPSVHLLPSLGRLLVGFNDKVAVIDIEKKSVVSEEHLEHLFACFLCLEDDNLLLVIYETGVVALNERGEHEWDFDGHDVVTDYDVRDGLLRVAFMDSSPAILRVSDGLPTGTS